jgi:hypothetical protein
VHALQIALDFLWREQPGIDTRLELAAQPGDGIGKARRVLLSGHREADDIAFSDLRGLSQRVCLSRLVPRAALAQNGGERRILLLPVELLELWHGPRLSSAELTLDKAGGFTV